MIESGFPEAIDQPTVSSTRKLAELLARQRPITEQYWNLRHGREYVKRTEIHPLARALDTMHYPFMPDLAQAKTLTTLYSKPTILVGTLDVNQDGRFTQAPNHAVLALNTGSTLYVDVTQFFSVAESVQEEDEEWVVTSIADYIASVDEKDLHNLLIGFAGTLAVITTRRVALGMIESLKYRKKRAKYKRSQYESERNTNGKKKDNPKIDWLVHVMTPEIRKLSPEQLATVMHGLRYIYSRYNQSGEMNEQDMESMLTDLHMHSHQDAKTFFGSAPEFVKGLKSELDNTDIQLRSRIARRVLGRLIDKTDIDPEMRNVYSLLRRYAGILSLM